MAAEIRISWAQVGSSAVLLLAGFWAIQTWMIGDVKNAIKEAQSDVNELQKEDSAATLRVNESTSGLRDQIANIDKNTALIKADTDRIRGDVNSIVSTLQRLDSRMDTLIYGSMRITSSGGPGGQAQYAGYEVLGSDFTAAMKRLGLEGKDIVVITPSFGAGQASQPPKP